MGTESRAILPRGVCRGRRGRMLVAQHQTSFRTILYFPLWQHSRVWRHYVWFRWYVTFNPDSFGNAAYAESSQD